MLSQFVAGASPSPGISWSWQTCTESDGPNAIRLMINYYNYKYDQFTFVYLIFDYNLKLVAANYQKLCRIYVVKSVLLK